MVKVYNVLKKNKEYNISIVLFSQDLSVRTTVTDLSGKVKMPALTIFSMAIGYLKDHALSLLNNPRYAAVTIELTDIFFVITVPAIWNDRSKLFMREAAVTVKFRFTIFLKHSIL